jgi:hypothetical protein
MVNRVAYARVAQILDQVLREGKVAEFTCESNKEAIATRHQMNLYRAALRKEGGPGATTPYDGLVLKVRGNKIIFDNLRLRGELRFHDTPLDAPPPDTTLPTDERPGVERALNALEASGAFTPAQIWSRMVESFDPETVAQQFTKRGWQPPDVL